MWLYLDIYLYRWPEWVFVEKSIKFNNLVKKTQSQAKVSLFIKTQAVCGFNIMMILLIKSTFLVKISYNLGFRLFSRIFSKD